jgi:hypothetical protein
MRIAPAMPASVSLKPCGLRIWLRRLLMLLKKPTYTENGRRICQNSQVLISCFVAFKRGVWMVLELEALAGVGGADGRKKDGIAATLDCG